MESYPSCWIMCLTEAGKIQSHLFESRVEYLPQQWAWPRLTERPTELWVHRWAHICYSYQAVAGCENDCLCTQTNLTQPIFRCNSASNNTPSVSYIPAKLSLCHFKGWSSFLFFSLHRLPFVMRRIVTLGKKPPNVCGNLFFSIS